MRILDMRIQPRLVLGFGVVIAMMAGIALFAVFEIGRINAILSEINLVNSVKQRYAINFRGSVHDRAISLRDAVLVGQASELDAALAEIGRLEDFYRKSAGPLDAMFVAAAPSQPDLAILDEIKAVEARTMPLASRVIAARKAGQEAAARDTLLNEARPAFTDWLRVINKFIDYQETRNKTLGQRVDEIVARFGALMAAVGSAAFAFACGMAYWNIRSLRPVSRLTGVMLKLAAGETNVALPRSDARDEVGDMIRAVEVFKRNAIEAAELRKNSVHQAESAERQRRRTVIELADAFETAVGGVVGQVSAAASQLQTTATSMSGTAAETASQSTTVATAAEEAACNVGKVAAAAEQLGSSVEEIGRQVQGSARLAHAAVAEAADTGRLVKDLSEAAAKIGDVVAMISTIAGQTNLLALNATIEAARAGEAGRGFAVVAAEVKELASQTARATEEIGGQIARIQGSTGQAVSAIDGIGSRIEEISLVATAIAAAVEEQAAATQEIVRNVSQAALGTGAVTRNITGVAGAAEETGAAASRVLASATDLWRQSERLSTEVGRFLGTVRAA